VPRHPVSPLIPSRSEGTYSAWGFMTILPFLSGRAFDHETIERMSEALTGENLKLIDGPETRLVVQKTIELAQRGVRDAATLQTKTLSAFRYE
jgi:hypothetical protein